LTRKYRDKGIPSRGKAADAIYDAMISFRVISWENIEDSILSPRNPGVFSIHGTGDLTCIPDRIFLRGLKKYGINTFSSPLPMTDNQRP
jgi:hypothetical protein